MASPYMREGVLLAVGIGIGAVASSFMRRDEGTGAADEAEASPAAASPAAEDVGLELATHNRYPYSAISQRKDYSWPGGKRLAVYFAINLEHFEFGKGMGAKLGGQCVPHCLLCTACPSACCPCPAALPLPSRTRHVTPVVKMVQLWRA